MPWFLDSWPGRTLPLLRLIFPDWRLSCFEFSPISMICGRLGRAPGSFHVTLIFRVSFAIRGSHFRINRTSGIISGYLYGFFERPAIASLLPSLGVAAEAARGQCVSSTTTESSCGTRCAVVSFGATRNLVAFRRCTQARQTASVQRAATPSGCSERFLFSSSRAPSH